MNIFSCFDCQMHMRIHINERKFKCDECGLAFMQKEFLTRHKLTHTGEVPFRCDTCGKAFRQLVNLKQHRIRKHFNNKNNKEQNQVRGYTGHTGCSHSKHYCPNLTIFSKP